MPDLETILAKLAQHGRPSLSLFDSGWCCTTDMHVSAAGASFKVRSDFGLASPIQAAAQCAERIDAMLRGSGAGEAKAITHG